MRAHVFALIGEQVEPMLRQFGSIGLMLVIFAESGLTTAFFLPGDSLLFVGGFLSSQGVLINVWPLSIGAFIAAVVGGHVGYATGKRLGPAMFRRPDSVIFRQSRLREAEQFFARHGAKAIVIARWMPVVRTFAPIVAGASRMPYRTFMKCNVLGALLWAFGLTQAGYWLGNQWPGVGERLELIIVVIMVASVLPIVIHGYVRHRRRQAILLTTAEYEALTVSSLEDLTVDDVELDLTGTRDTDRAPANRG